MDVKWEWEWSEILEKSEFLKSSMLKNIDNIGRAWK